MRYFGGPEAALAEADRLGPAPANYGLLHATRAELLRDLGRLAEARPADEQALALITNPAERGLVEQRLS